MNDNPSIDELCVNTIRFLSIDAVEKARSGHPGTPMGTAALAYVLWDRYPKFNPLDPEWPDRDRTVLSCGHASMLLYSLLLLTGYDLTIAGVGYGDGLYILPSGQVALTCGLLRLPVA